MKEIILCNSTNLLGYANCYITPGINDDGYIGYWRDQYNSSMTNTRYDVTMRNSGAITIDFFEIYSLTNETTTRFYVSGGTKTGDYFEPYLLMIRLDKYIKGILTHSAYIYADGGYRHCDVGSKYFTKEDIGKIIPFYIGYDSPKGTKQ